MNGTPGEGGARPDQVVMGAHLPDGVPRTAANVCYSVGALVEVMAKWVEQPHRAWTSRELSAASGLNRHTVRMVVRDVIAAGHAAQVPSGDRRAHLYRLTSAGVEAWRHFRSEARVRLRPVKAQPPSPRL